MQATYITKNQFLSIQSQVEEQKSQSPKAVGIEPIKYFAEWIPKIYPGIEEGSKSRENPYNLTWREACIKETLQYFPHLDESTIDKNWGKVFEKRPNYAPGVFALAHTQNLIKEALGVIRK